MRAETARRQGGSHGDNDQAAAATVQTEAGTKRGLRAAVASVVTAVPPFPGAATDGVAGPS